jgi:phage terminase large subunit-like protein
MSAAPPANTISPASISNPRLRSAAAWSRLAGSSATAQRDLPDRFERMVQSWDTANKATELSD